MPTLKIIISGISPDKQELVIGMLEPIAIEGFEEKETVLDIYLSEEIFTDTVNKAYLDKVIKGSMNLKYDVETLPEKNWNELWEQNFDPVIIDNIIIRPPFYILKDNNSYKYDIIIQPKMSFGTGHHETTYMMASLLSDILVRGRSVLDIGSGTGILSILAKMIGAESVVAIDNDPWCSENALENIELNEVDGIKIVLGELEEMVEEKVFDVILANINRNYLLEHLKTIVKYMSENSILLISGFLLEDAKLIGEKALESGLIFNTLKRKGDWLAASLIRIN